MRNVGISLSNNIVSSIRQTYGTGSEDVFGRICTKLSCLLTHYTLSGPSQAEENRFKPWPGAA